MLRELIRTIAESQAHSQADLARELGASEGLLVQMLEDLARRGYLEPLAEGCSSQCAGCPLAKTCAVGSPTRVWTLTEKGLGLVKKRRYGGKSSCAPLLD